MGASLNCCISCLPINILSAWAYNTCQYKEKLLVTMGVVQELAGPWLRRMGLVQRIVYFYFLFIFVVHSLCLSDQPRSGLWPRALGATSSLQWAGLIFPRPSVPVPHKLISSSFVSISLAIPLGLRASPRSWCPPTSVCLHSHVSAALSSSPWKVVSCVTKQQAGIQLWRFSLMASVWKWLMRAFAFYQEA